MSVVGREEGSVMRLVRLPTSPLKPSVLLQQQQNLPSSSSPSNPSVAAAAGRVLDLGGGIGALLEATKPVQVRLLEDVKELLLLLLLLVMLLLVMSLSLSLSLLFSC